MKCNFDCFHCQFPDCVCNKSAPPTPWERAALQNVKMGYKTRTKKPGKERVHYAAN